MSGKKQLHTLPDGKAFGVHIERVDEEYRVTCESPRFAATVAIGERGGFGSVLTDAGSYETHVIRENGAICVEVAGERFLFGTGVDAAGAESTKRASARCEVKAPMPGKVVKLLVGAGDTVTSGQGVLLFEAMKMQNEIKSPQDGVVGEMAVEEGQAVDARDRLFVISNTK